MLVSYDKFHDHRGCLYTVYDERRFDLDKFGIKFVEDRVSNSVYGTIRGFHGDWKTWKLISCLYGKLKLVTFNIVSRKREEYYLSHKDKDSHTVLVPPGVLNGHQCLTDECVLHYKWSEHYEGPEKQISIRYNDVTINPQWKFLPSVIISDRDLNAETFVNFILRMRI